jgi:hypothetical protein
MLRHGAYGSVHAGFFEEVTYRWFVFYAAMVMVPFFNTITGGLVHIINEYILLPAANICTFGALHAQLYGPYGWMFGAAIVFASIRFSDAHANQYQQINAWFLGMVFFWLMFNYGLWAAIVAHILYDLCVDAVASFSAMYQREMTLGEIVTGALSRMLS